MANATNMHQKCSCIDCVALIQTALPFAHLKHTNTHTKSLSHIN